jgi:hypothetical protein
MRGDVGEDDSDVGVRWLVLERIRIANIKHFENFQVFYQNFQNKTL